MSASVFVDTNVLIYARDRRAAGKRIRAAAWLAALGASSAGRINLQIMNELTRWMLANETSRSLDEIRADVDLLSSWGGNAVSPQEIDMAWIIRGRTGYQWFDCLLLAAAEHLGCTHFLTEDMQDGAMLGSLTIVSPFRLVPADLLPPH